MIQFAMLSMSLASAHPATTDVQRQFDRWERRLRARVAELHVVPVDAARDPACDVTIGFAIGADGRPTNATIRKSTCKAFYERATRRLVRQLGTIGRIPSVNGTDHFVELRLSYGVAPTAEADRQLSESLEAERRAYASRNLRIVTTLLRTASASH